MCHCVLIYAVYIFGCQKPEKKRYFSIWHSNIPVSISPTRLHVLLSIPTLCPPEPCEPKQRAGRSNQASFKARTVWFFHCLRPPGQGPGTTQPSASGFLSCSSFYCFPLPRIRFINSQEGSLRTMSVWTALVFPTDSVTHHSPQ